MLSLATFLPPSSSGPLTAYVLFGGADFGGGVWDLLDSGPRRTQQRDLIAHCPWPVWERITSGSYSDCIAVHLFPRVRTIAISLHIPLR